MYVRNIVRIDIFEFGATVWTPAGMGSVRGFGERQHLLRQSLHGTIELGTAASQCDGAITAPSTGAKGCTKGLGALGPIRTSSRTCTTSNATDDGIDCWTPTERDSSAARDKNL